MPHGDPVAETGSIIAFRCEPSICCLNFAIPASRNLPSTANQNFLALAKTRYPIFRAIRLNQILEKGVPMGPTILAGPALNLRIISNMQRFKIPGLGQRWKHEVTNCHY